MAGGRIARRPRPLDTAPDAGLAWEQVVARHLALLDKAPPALKQRFLADAQWLDHYGLPVSAQEYSNSVVVRAQRATLQYWKEAVPWAAKGSVSVANGGDLAKEAGLFPWLAVTPDNASSLIVTVLDEAGTIDALLESIARTDPTARRSGRRRRRLDRRDLARARRPGRLGCRCAVFERPARALPAAAIWPSRPPRAT